MRPLYLTRAASRGSRAALRAVLLLVLSVLLLLTVGLAHAQVRYLSRNISDGTPAQEAVNESPVQPYEVGLLFQRWEQAERRHFSKELLPLVAELGVRARIRGVTSLEALPPLMVVEADVTHQVAGGHDCSAGADSYARLLQTAKPDFLTTNERVKETVERLGKAYEGCAEARAAITKVAGSGLAGVIVTGMVEGAKAAELAAERERAAVVELTTPKTTQPAQGPETWLHSFEDSVTGWVVALGGEQMAVALAAAPWLDPDSPHFKRFVWWSVLSLLFVGGVNLHSWVTQAVKDSMRPRRGVLGIQVAGKAPRSGAAAAPGRRKSTIVRHRR